jgi:hypothetical protein
MLRIFTCSWFFILNFKMKFNMDLVKMNFIENMADLLHNGLW